MAASDEALNRNRGALTPLPLGRKSNGVAGKPSGSSTVSQNGHRLKNDRLVAENLQNYFRMIGSPGSGKEQHARHVDESPIRNSLVPSPYRGAGLADSCFVVSHWRRDTSQCRPSLGASQAPPHYLLFE